MASNPNQLFLLADHIKLSLLERQRAISLNLAPNSQDSQISRSLDSLWEGIQAIDSNNPDLSELPRLRSQYNDLSRQFHGDNPSSTAEATISSPNDPSLAPDFQRAKGDKTLSQTQAESQQRSSSLKRSDTARQASKSVRFRDNPSASPDLDDEANRAALFPEGRYRDDPAATAGPDTEQMSNQQIHAYHSQVLQDQDEQLDTLSQSIGRQRYLGMQIGDELDGQAELLDEVDRGVDRHQGRLNTAKRRLNTVSRKAKENWSMTTIIVLIVILVFLIVVLK
ncbi:MAG: hypothetical protein Q9227_006770 [Pyrenula ochraceoflavens]